MLQLDRLTPGTIEPDSELEISGNGFPENRRGTLLLDGIAHTPARPPRRVSWEIPLVADSRTTIFVRPTERTLRELTEGAAHVTFRGTARVHFSALVEGRPPLRGMKEGVVLDLFSPSSGVEEDPAAFLEFIGIEVGSDLVIEELVADSIADRAGLEVGDTLRTLDGVRLDSLRDLLPQAQARTSVMEFSRRGFQGLGEAQIDRADFQLLESGMAARALALLAGVALALIWAARPPRFLLWLFGDKSRARRGRAVWLSDLDARLQFIAYPVFLVVVVAFWWLLRMGGNLVIGAAFLGALALGSLLLLTSAFVLGGRRSDPHKGFSLLGALSATTLRLLVLVPILVASIARASDAGSLQLHEIARDQGIWPGGWAAVLTPLSFVLSVAYLVSLVPVAGRRAPLEGYLALSSPSLVIARSCEWAGQLVLVSLWVALFAGDNFGASNSPALGGVLLSLKIATVAHVLAWVRARSGHLRLSESWGFFGVANLAVSIVAAGLSVGLVVTGIGAAHAELFALFATACGGSMLVLLYVSSQRSWAHMGRRIDPWI